MLSPPHVANISAGHCLSVQISTLVHTDNPGFTKQWGTSPCAQWGPLQTNAECMEAQGHGQQVYWLVPISSCHTLAVHIRHNAYISLYHSFPSLSGISGQYVLWNPLHQPHTYSWSELIITIWTWIILMKDLDLVSHFHLVSKIPQKITMPCNLPCTISFSLWPCVLCRDIGA